MGTLKGCMGGTDDGFCTGRKWQMSDQITDGPRADGRRVSGRAATYTDRKTEG